MTGRISPLPLAILVSSATAVSVAVAAPLHTHTSHRARAHATTVCHRTVLRSHRKLRAKCPKPAAHAARHRIAP
ncbi:hypothetical protein ABTD78_20900, partial [Acinetobacter baumannii]